MDNLSGRDLEVGAVTRRIRTSQLFHSFSKLAQTDSRTMHRLSLDTEALRAYRVVFMICVLHISDALRPVATRCGNTNLGPAFGYQDRQSIIPRRGEFRARPVVQVDITIAVRPAAALYSLLRPSACACSALGAPNHVPSVRSQQPTSAPRHPPNGRSGAGQRRLALAPVNCM